MKKIEALIRPSDLETVKEELDEAGIRNVIASEALCLGETSHERRVYRGSVYIVDAAPCTRSASSCPTSYSDAQSRS
jgi:nitrogen regulatory protein PII